MDRALQELIEFQPDGHPVLSLYLNVDPARRLPEDYKLRLRNMLKEVSGQADPADVDAVSRYFDHIYDWSGRSVVIFSCQARDFWRAFSLPVPVQSRARVADRPHVKPLADVNDMYGQFAVVLVDKQGARLLHYSLGGLVETTGTMGEEVKHHKQGGWSATRFQRHMEEVAQHNMKDAAGMLARFCQARGCKKLVLGGTEENIAAFRALLARQVQDMIAGTINVDMTANEGEVQEKALEVLQRQSQEAEAALVDQIITGAAKAQNAVVGLDDTLMAVNEGRVLTLIFTDQFRSPGWQCAQCGVITAIEMDACAFCGGMMKHIPDVVNVAVQKVLAAQNGRVEVVHDNPTLAKAGHIGALLRY